MSQIEDTRTAAESVLQGPSRSAAEISTDIGYLAADVPEDLFSELTAKGLVPDVPGLRPSR